ncbi:MAG: ATP-dependent DNA helicase RecG [Alphaproteobacteria bacterium]|nr:ATP-dependent DNA helicase RecG [Alphaproteobacteria bacterium]
MQHDPLAAVFAPLTSLRGIGPAVAKLIARAAGGDRVIDLLFHLPESYLDRRDRPTIARAVPGRIATLEVEVVRHDAPARPRQPWKIVIRDSSGFAELVFFKFTRQAQMPPGTRLLVSGKLEKFGDRLTMPHPDHMVPADRPERLPGLEPVWPLTAGLWPRQVATAMAQALAHVPDLPEWHEPALLRRERWPGFRAALGAIQTPAEPPGNAARRRIAYDELLADQVALALVRGRVRARPGRALIRAQERENITRIRAQDLTDIARIRAGHTLTNAQIRALAEIEADLAAPRRMLRLLQGDVGSGKTLVAVLAMLRAAEAGAQAALMAPTEVLAKQHHATLSRLCPVPVALLTGSVKGTARAHTLRGLADGSIPLVVGTHALFQEAVAYHDLALAVIDEQHRFGVHQRVMLGDKGERTDVLVMTATPIPRTILLTEWGEMDVSRLDEKPPGRQPIRTTLHSLATLPDVLDALARKLDEGGQIYWVCPMVAESELLDVAAAEARFADLRARFGTAVGLAHGQQDAALRDAALADFAAGRTRLLVATTVIEVGVDVPQASVMVIEHAERFGLAQLHQLRGRVGRGEAASFCLLLHDDGLNETARRRLTLLRDTEDGFLIADEDFRLRGGGDLMGTRQSGEPGFRLAHPVEHEDLLHMANRDAALLLHRDPTLTSVRGRAVRVLLRLFERSVAMKTLVSG